jgi:hypothetical protein
VKLLLDWRLRRDLPGHEVKTVQEMGWQGIKNGRLLALAQTEFDVFLTGDRNLSFQENIASLLIAVVVLKAPSIRLIDTRKLMPQVIALLHGLKQGEVVTVSF